MSDLKVISIKQNGASIKLKISLKDAKDGHLSEEHSIHNMLIVRFRISRCCSDGRKDLEISMKKHENAIDLTFDVNVTGCIFESTGYTIRCPKDWSDWFGDYYTPQWTVNVYVKMNIIRIYPTTIQKIHKDDTFVDFELSADDGSVFLHRSYLAAHSDVFKTMLSGQWKETAQGRLELPGVTRQTLQYFKDFMYLRALPDDGLCPLLLIAIRYLVEDLKTECMIKVMQTITPENLDSHIEFAAENEMRDLIDTIIEYIPDSIFAEARILSLKGLKLSSSSSDEK